MKERTVSANKGTNKEPKRILNKYKLESNQRRKVNTIRKNAGLEEIDVKALDKEL